MFFILNEFNFAVGKWAADLNGMFGTLDVNEILLTLIPLRN